MTKPATNAVPKISTLGIDIAKNVVQLLHGVDRRGRVRDQLIQVLGQLEACTIAVVACTGVFT